jgi:hypothetical protein
MSEKQITRVGWVGDDLQEYLIDAYKVECGARHGLIGGDGQQTKPEISRSSKDVDGSSLCPSYSSKDIHGS